MSFDELYQSILLDHYQHPRNAGPVHGATCSIHDHNPICGDEITVAMQIENGKVTKVGFDGKGCAISVASASMMTEQLLGKKVEDAKQDVEAFLSIMRNEDEFDNHPEFEELASLEGVKKLHARIKCATLSWNTAKRLLEGDSD